MRNVAKPRRNSSSETAAARRASPGIRRARPRSARLSAIRRPAAACSAARLARPATLELATVSGQKAPARRRRLRYLEHGHTVVAASAAVRNRLQRVAAEWSAQRARPLPDRLGESKPARRRLVAVRREHAARCRSSRPRVAPERPARNSVHTTRSACAASVPPASRQPPCPEQRMTEAPAAPSTGARSAPDGRLSDMSAYRGLRHVPERDLLARRGQTGTSMGEADCGA